jgi:hypothetical protein
LTAVNGTAFSEGAIFVTNQSKDYNYSLTGQLKKRFSAGLSANFAYTYNRAYDIQSFTSDRAISNWRNGREFSGTEDDAQLTTSVFERRHRISRTARTMPWLRSKAPTEVNFYFERQSGSPSRTRPARISTATDSPATIRSMCRRTPQTRTRSRLAR